MNLQVARSRLGVAVEGETIWVEAHPDQVPMVIVAECSRSKARDIQGSNIMSVSISRSATTRPVHKSSPRAWT
jgi:hypothetical protein